MTAAGLAEALHLRRTGRGWRGECPVHGGGSFCLDERDGVPVWTCWSGCDRGAILSELRRRGLWPEQERREWSAEERRRYARQWADAEAVARLAGDWQAARLAELEEAKAAALADEGGFWDVETLAAAASEHYRLSTASAEGVIRQWQAARELDPVGTRATEREGAAWREARERVTWLVVGKMAREVAERVA